MNPVVWWPVTHRGQSLVQSQATEEQTQETGLCFPVSVAESWCLSSARYGAVNRAIGQGECPLYLQMAGPL